MLKTIIDRVRRQVMGFEKWGRLKGVTIGQGCRILSNPVTSEPWLVSIGDRVTISTNVSFVTHDGSGWLVDDERGRRYRYAPIRIGNEVFVGTGVTILPGVSIGDRVVVGAGSIVTKSVPSGTVVAGVPARKVSSFEDFHARVATWKSENEMVGSTYRERVDSIAEGFVLTPPAT